VRNKSRQLRRHVPSSPTYCESLLKWDRPQTPIAIHGPLGLTYHLLQKAIAIADCLENHFTPHDTCDEIHARRVEAKAQAQVEAVVNNLTEKV